jgi:hypothetical protein
VTTKRKKTLSNTCPPTLSSRGTAQHCGDSVLYISVSEGSLIALIYSALIESEEALQRILTPVKPFDTSPGPLEWCDSPRPDVYMRALI